MHEFIFLSKPTAFPISVQISLWLAALVWMSIYTIQAHIPAPDLYE